MQRSLELYPVCTFRKLKCKFSCPKKKTVEGILVKIICSLYNPQGKLRVRQFPFPTRYLDHDANADGDVGKPANKVGRPIDGINHPRGFIGEDDLFSRRARFFSDDLVIRKTRLNCRIWKMKIVKTSIS